MKMKKIMIAAASLMFVVTAQANDVTMMEVEMTPIVKQAPQKAVAAKQDTRFANYALENAASGGQ
jgi:hypothetical protein